MLKSLDDILLQKISEKGSRTFLLGIWAGAYISLGTIFYSVITSFNGSSELLKFLGALAFTIGLNLVVFKKAQLFTGNNLMILSIMTNKANIRSILQNWILVYFGNLVGSLVIVTVFHLASSPFEILSTRLAEIASLKTSYDLPTAFTKAILCNMLVCTAIYFAVSMKSLKTKVIGLMIPITVFVYLGFEHSIANMFFIPVGLSFKTLALRESLQLFTSNIIPVTIGNILGGAIMSALLLLLSKIKP